MPDGGISVAEPGSSTGPYGVEPQLKGHHSRPVAADRHLSPERFLILGSQRFKRVRHQVMQVRQPPRLKKVMLGAGQAAPSGEYFDVFLFDFPKCEEVGPTSDPSDRENPLAVL